MYSTDVKLLFFFVKKKFIQTTLISTGGILTSENAIVTF